MKYNRFMGEYDDNTIYQAGDVVNFDGASYYRKVPGKGISPIARKKPYTVWSRLNEALSTIFPLGVPGGGGASLPPAAPYQQLVTDGEGKWVAEERLAWKESKVESKTLYHFTETTPMVNYVIMRPYNMIPDCVVGNTYHVECPQLGVDDDVVCDQFQTNFPRLLIEGKLQIDYSIMDLSTTFWRLDGGTFENGESYDFIISEQAEVETIYPIPEEYLPVDKILFTYDGTNYTCNVTFEEFAKAAYSGANIMLAQTGDDMQYSYYAVVLRKRNSGERFDISFGTSGNKKDVTYLADGTIQDTPPE